MIFTATQHALVSTCGCCVLPVQSIPCYNGLAILCLGAVRNLRASCTVWMWGYICEPNTMYVYVALHIAKKACGLETRAWPRGVFTSQISIAEGYCSSWAVASVHSFTSWQWAGSQLPATSSAAPWGWCSCPSSTVPNLFQLGLVSGILLDSLHGPAFSQHGNKMHRE